MRRLYIETVYNHDGTVNEQETLTVIKNEINDDTAPLAPELLYAQVLDFTDPKQKKIAQKAALSWVNDDLPKVVIESPFSGDIEANIAYAKAAVKNRLMNNEAPIASHLIYTQILDDDDPDDRMLGIHAGFAWNSKADKITVFTNNGISGGMKYGISNAEKNNTPIEYLTIPDWDNSPDNPRSFYHDPLIMNNTNFKGARSHNNRITYGSCGIAHKTALTAQNCHYCQKT